MTLSVFFVLLAQCKMSKVCISVDVLICLLSNGEMKQAIINNRTLYSYFTDNRIPRLNCQRRVRTFSLHWNWLSFFFCALMTSSYRRKMTTFKEVHLKLTLTCQNHMISFSLYYFFTTSPPAQPYWGFTLQPVAFEVGKHSVKGKSQSSFHNHPFLLF